MAVFLVFYGNGYYILSIPKRFFRTALPWGPPNFIGRVVVGLALFELDVKSLERKFTEVRDHL